MANSLVGHCLAHDQRYPCSICSPHIFDTAKYLKPEPAFQYFWSCAHYPISIKNFFEGRTTCEFECHAQPLRWFDNGVHPMPKSWGRAANDSHIGV